MHARNLLAAIALLNLSTAARGQDTPKPVESPAPATGQSSPHATPPQPPAAVAPPPNAPAAGATQAPATPDNAKDQPANELPPVVVEEPVETPAKKAKAGKPKDKADAELVKSSPVEPAAGSEPAAQAAPAVSPAVSPDVQAAAATQAQTEAFDSARQILSPNIGASTYSVPHEAIESLPQGQNASLDKVLLQTPGVTQDSAASGQIHVRNEHANVQYRIDGIIVPEGVSGFGQFLDTSFVGSLALVTGALPAQYGLRTSGIVDIQTRASSAPAGEIGIYGGSHATLTPSIEYGGTTGRSQYFFTARGLWNDVGIENPTPAYDAIHDDTKAGKAFGYVSTLLDDTTRVTSIAGVSVQHFQIPNNPGQPPQFTAFGVSTFDSDKLDQNQSEQGTFGVIALQKKLDDADLQLAYFTRYSDVHYRPDPIGDLVFNGVASDVDRSSLLNGLQADAAWRVDPAHTLRGGLFVSAESTRLADNSIVLPVVNGKAVDAPFRISDTNDKLGWLFGIYLQDEWRLTDTLTLNAGLRFDEMLQFVDASQVSPRVSLTWNPLDGTTLHAGYARYFTPPSQVVAGLSNLALVQGTTQQPEVTRNDPVLPERSHYLDAGLTQRLTPGLEIGVDGYYKIARDLLDDGQFGQAYVLTGFNYDHAVNYGVEFKATYDQGPLRVYGNLAWAEQKARTIVSNQFLFEADELAYIATHDIFTDHAQTLTASAGASYLWEGTRFSADFIYGSGLRNGFANTAHLPAYTQVNLGVSHEFKIADMKPLTVRFDVVNVFDEVYELRDGSGIGVFAPQFGGRRGFFVGLSQKF